MQIQSNSHFFRSVWIPPTPEKTITFITIPLFHWSKKPMLSHVDQGLVCSGNGYTHHLHLGQLTLKQMRIFLTSPHLNSAVIVNIRPSEHANFWHVSLCFFYPFSSGASCHSSVAQKFQFLMDFTVTEVHTNGHRAENNSCLTCVSMSTERFC